MIEKEVQNLTSEFVAVAANSTNQAVSIVWQKISPLIEILGGLFVIYIVYKIIQAVLNYFLRRKIDRVDLNIQNINKKVDEILKILSKKKKK